MKCRVHITKKVEKQLKMLPRYIKEAMLLWATSVEMIGVRDVRKISSYHDEPLRGKREGERSIRLNRSYRAIYIEEKESCNKVILIAVIEVSKHEY